MNHNNKSLCFQHEWVILSKGVITHSLRRPAWDSLPNLLYSSGPACQRTLRKIIYTKELMILQKTVTHLLPLIWLEEPRYFLPPLHIFICAIIYFLLSLPMSIILSMCFLKILWFMWTITYVFKEVFQHQIVSYEIYKQVTPYAMNSLYLCIQ